jgi:large repetitive protein
MSRIVSITIAVLVGALALGTGVQAAVKGKSSKSHARLAAPSLLSPADGTRVEQIPALTWSAVKGAARYEYQLSADAHFHSIVLGSGPGTGTSVTHNLGAALSKTVPDGTYYWHVRALGTGARPGKWSRVRKLVKAWAQAPHLLGPADQTAVAWPSQSLVLSWTPVSHATAYIVTVATDPALSNIVLGSATSPPKTEGTVYAPQGTLATGRYYWAITPLDAEGHRGTRSAIASFSWSWPTATATHLNDLNPDPRVFDPQFTWSPVPGAARYEVEVNSAIEFPLGSKWCCTDLTTGTSLSPTVVLANNGYYWRVRAIDPNGNAGVWNEGAAFTKAFDSVTPTVPNLTMSDVHADSLSPGVTTDTPIVTWSPVAGAAAYEIQVDPYVQVTKTEFACDWANKGHEEHVQEQTGSLYWTPGSEVTKGIGPEEWPRPNGNGALKQGLTYCVRVLARSDDDARGGEVISNWTQVGGEDQPAFTFAKQPAIVGELSANPSISYVLPAPSAFTTRTPLYTWERVEGAAYYYVVIARDSGFTHVLDVAPTIVPAYAPALIPDREEPLIDETTAYYWAVVPFNAKGEEFAEPPTKDHPQAFNKSSIPPTPVSPINGVSVANQPTFSWTPAEGELNYTLQVAEDPSFANPIDNVKTDSISYTSSSTYPSDITLYWRVRANNVNGDGLNWSATQEFRRTLPVPSPASENPTGGPAIPALSWTPVQGATGYEMHVDQPDGTTKDFKLDSTSFTPTEFFGTGIWRWKVRANFPTKSSGAGVSGGYFGSQPFARTMPPVTGVSAVKSGSRVVISWAPDPYANRYEVELSDTETFRRKLEARRVDGPAWAPDLDPKNKATRGTLYWRVAAVDKHGNVGPSVSGAFGARKHKARCTAKHRRKGRRTCAASKKHR